IAEQPWSAVSEARIAGSEPIPRLDDLLGAWPDVRLNIDVKEDAAVEPFVDAVRRTGGLDRICVASFSDRRLRRVRAALGPRLCTSMGPAEIARLRFASYGRPLRPLTPRSAGCVQVPVRAFGLPVVTRGFVDTAHAAGVQVHVWTVNTRAEMERLLELGVDGLMTDEVQTLRTVLVERGSWVAGHATGEREGSGP
ncbi:MAG TPA: glycerophosphodiester phosphodiesterase family protein, partial [Streptosporangiales bacterium]